MQTDFFDINTKLPLHSISPIGIGTSEMESMGNYTRRLAESHCVSVPNMIGYTFPEFRRQSPSSEGRLQLCANWKNDEVLLARNIQNNTGRSDLMSLSLEKLRLLAAPQSLFKKERHWCPACLLESPHERALWRIQGVDHCLKHQIKLQNRCIRCRRGIKQTHTSPFHYCSHCSVHLGREIKESFKPTLWEDFCISQIGEIITSIHQIEPISPDHLAQNIGALVKQRFQCVREAGEYFGLRESFFTNIKAGYSSRPALETWMRLAYGTGCHVLDLMKSQPLCGSLPLFNTVQPPEKLFEPVSRTKSRSIVVSKVERIVKPVEMGSFSIRKAAQLAGTSTTFINRHSPEVAQKIKILQKKFKEKLPLEKKILRKGLFHTGISRCTNHGLVPTLYSVKKAVGFPAVLQKSDIRQEFENILENYSY